MDSDIKQNRNLVEISTKKTKSYFPSEEDYNLLNNKNKRQCNIHARIRYETLMKTLYLNRTTDTRIRIFETLKWPYSPIGSLYIKFNEEYWLGTGTLISKNLVITAAHNIFCKDEFDGAELEFYPAINGDNYVEYSKINKIYIPNDYYSGKSKYDDYCLLELDKPLGYLFGYFGITVLPEDQLKKKEFHLFGYPGDKINDNQEYQMWGMDVSISNIKSNSLVEYLCDSYSGMSGSCIFYQEEGSMYIIGVHIMHNSQTRKGFAVYFNESRYDQIINWSKS